MDPRGLLLGDSDDGLNLDPVADPTVAADALIFTLQVLGTILGLHDDGCAAESAGHITAAVHEYVCRDCAPRRDLIHALRVARRGGDFYVQQMLAEPDRWLPIVALATAGSLSLTHEDPHELLDHVAALVRQDFWSEGQHAN